MYPNVPGVAFKDIEGFSGYCVGDDGSVWSRKIRGGYIAKGKERPLGLEWLRIRPSIQRSGHHMVQLCGHGGKVYRQVHRLVLEAFIGPMPEGMETCHGLGGPGDNSLKNIRWGTRSSNATDRNRFGKAVAYEQHGRAKIAWADVQAIRSVTMGRGVLIELCNRYGLGRSQIQRIRRGEQWKEER